MTDISDLINNSTEDDFNEIIEEVCENVNYAGFFMDFRATLLEYDFETKPELISQIGEDAYKKIWNQRLMTLASVDQWDQIFTARYLGEVGLPIKSDVRLAKKVAKLVLLKEYFERDSYDSNESA